jgi:hypothetical protein
MIEFPTLFFAGLTGVNQRTVNIMHSKYRDCCTFKFITKGWKSNDFSMLGFCIQRKLIKYFISNQHKL